MVVFSKFNLAFKGSKKFVELVLSEHDFLLNN